VPLLPHLAGEALPLVARLLQPGGRLLRLLPLTQLAQGASLVVERLGPRGVLVENLFAVVHRVAPLLKLLVAHREV